MTNNPNSQHQRATALWQKAEKLLKTGDPGRARPILEELLRLAPKEPAHNYNLGACYFELQRFERSIKYLRNTLQLDQNLAEAHYLLGRALKASGKIEQSIKTLRRYLELKPNDTEAMVTLADCLDQVGHSSEGEKILARAAALNPKNPNIQIIFARTLHKNLNFVGAIGHFKQVFKTGLMDTNILQEFVDMAQYIQCYSADSELLELVEKCFDDSNVEPHRIVRVALELLSFEPDINLAMRICDDHNDDRGTELIRNPYVLALLRRPIFNKILVHNLICSADFERIITVLRSAYLKTICEGGVLNELESLYAIAIACFNSHYVYFETAKEKAEIEDLCDILEAKGEDIGEELERQLLLIYSAYRPPMSLSNSDILSNIHVTNSSENFRNWHLQTIRQPYEEIALAKSISVLTSVENNVSMKVKVQYDENPYPRWFQAPNVQPHTPAQLLRKIFVHFNPPQQLDGACPILVAGCGSGWHAVLIAKLYPQSQITALDLSRTNLAFAVRRTKELNITNIDYFQGDILSLGKLELSFPYVESVGVLHHLGDPISGWKVLADITQPGGIMHIGLYSEHARKELNEARKFAAAGNYKSNQNDIRRFRQEVFSLPSKSEDMQKLVRNREFYSMSSCRDLLFHAQEHRFTIDQIQHALNQLGLEFIGFQINGIHYAEMYRQNFPDDPKMTHLENWEQFENAHPDVFNRQYDFYCRKLG